MKKKIGFFVLLGCLVLIYSCNQKSEYQQIVDKELVSGVRYDTLFYGIYFGMPSKDFYAHCWKMNKEGWIKQGPGNMSVYAKITEINYPASMNFYPTFHEDKIVTMPVEFSYDQWAPWTKELQSDSLQLQIKGLMEQWYGKGFISIENPNKITGGTAFVKVNGNRRISIYKLDDAKVKVDFVDLLAKQQMDKLAEK